MAGEYWLAMRADGFKGTGSAIDPYDASSPSLFNSVLNDIADKPENAAGRVTVHIGPGIFQVPAYPTEPRHWFARARWRIIGAGRRATVLKVVNAGTEPRVHCIFQNESYYQHADGFTVEDLTIDCNMRGHKDIGRSTGAMLVAGSRTKVRRVRVVDFGTEIATNECFPLAMANAEPRMPEVRNCEISDCIVEQPSPNNVRETTILNFGAGEFDDNGTGNPSLRGVMAYHRSCAMRRNMVDCDYSVDQRQIKALTYVGTSATATTFQPHNRKVGDWILISGALVYNPTEPDLLRNPFNGSFQVASINGHYEFSYRMQAEPANEPTGTMWLGRVPCQAISIVGIEQSGSNPWVITITTYKPHFRMPGQNVKIEGVNKLSNPSEPAIFSGPQGAQRIIDVPSPTVFRFALSADPQNDWIVGGFIGVSLQALSADGGSGALVERNRVFGAVIGGPYHDTWHTKDILVQKNYYYATHTALYQNMGGLSGTFPGFSPRYAESLTRGIPDNTTATMTTPFFHGLAVAQVFRVDNAFVGGNPSPEFNGSFAVEQVLTPKSFRYRMIGDPGGNADTTPPGNRPILGIVWQTGRIIYTGNVVEPITNPLGTGPPPTAFAIGSNPTFSPYYVFREVIIARNRFRNIDGGSDPLSIGMFAYSTESGIIQKNVISGMSNIPIRHFDIGPIKHFHNTDFGGEPFQSFFFTTFPVAGLYLNQTETELDLALTAKPTS